MNLSTADQTASSALPPAAADYVRNVVTYVKNHTGPRPRRFQERRASQRQAFPYLIELIPLDGHNRPCGESLIVLGKHLSDHGLDFYHQGPLPHRRFLAKLDTGDAEPVQLVLDISWCRFIKRGWYETGGKFLRLLPETETAPRLHN